MSLDTMSFLEKDTRISESGRSELKRYLESLPGFAAGAQEKAEELHGFLTMQFARSTL